MPVILTFMVTKMPKQFLKKYMPNPEVLKQHKSLQFLGAKLHDPNLWHLNRRSVAIAFAVGLFCAWIPTPTQMALAAFGAFYFRGNLPIAVGLVWLTNPITMPPLFYFAYRVGLSVLNMPSAEFSLEAVLSGGLWAPFLTGCLIMGVICSTAGYFGIQGFWAYYVSKKWMHRQKKRGRKPLNPFRAMY
jgi:uncharacterized protein (DUF2062 family)